MEKRAQGQKVKQDKIVLCADCDGNDFEAGTLEFIS